jgi:diguanylate cyclase (GGDEF)-like protein/PAS domain S-box-containing protein
LKDEHGQPAYLLGISEDITERKQAELNLQESESRLSALFDTKAISIVVIDKWGIIERFNAASEVMFGYSSAEVVGRNVNVLMPEPYHSEHDAYVKHYVESGERRVIGIGREVVGRRKDGATFLMELLVGDTGTGGDHSFIGFCQDITERKRLAAAGKLFELVVRSSDDAIVTQQLDGTITSWNPGAEALFGYPAGEMIGRSVLKLFPPDRLDEEFAIQVKIRRREQVKHLETIRVRKDGSLFDVSLTLSPILDDNGTVVGISKIVRDISERKKSDNAIHNLAFYDPLTELPNRRLFYDRLTIALSVSARTEQYGALMFLDLDNFKALNDSQGHDAGDQLLVEVANRLKSCVREVDTVARLGGDEFVVLIENLGSDENDASQTVAHVAEKIRESLATPYEIRQTSHHSTPSIGVYVFLGDIDVVDDVIKRADIAMYQAKDSGRNSVRFYNPELQKLVQDRASLESDLLEGIESQQLQLYYQIQVDNELRPFGAEALIRWNHPVRGLVSPVVFIPVAEESTLILDIGYWVLDNACQQISAWSKHKHTSELILAVNVSAKQFRQLDFVEIVKSLIDKHHINPSRLKLELTESVALNDLDFVIAKMQALREVLGVKLSLDDFGTGYSSLSYLKRLPLHQVKIDQSFVRDMVTDASDDLLVKTIIDMAHNFNLDVIAEGVETEAQLTRLGEHGCTSYQGYLFSKPVPVAEFEKLLNESPIQIC